MAQDARLLGTWTPHSGTQAGDLVSIEFREDGSLLYTIRLEGETRTLPLLYESDGEMLTTSDEFSGILASSRYEMRPDGSLQLSFNGEMYVYDRGEVVH